MRVLLTAGSPTVVVLARSVQGTKLPPEWTEPLAQGHMAVMSGVATVRRLTQTQATERNALVAQLHPWRLEGRQVELQ